MRVIPILIFFFILSVASDAQGEPANLDDYAFQHCSVLISTLSIGLPMWRDEGMVPLARAQNTLDEIIAGDPIVNIPTTQAGFDLWHRAVASTPQDMSDWNAAIEYIYHSKITGREIEGALRRYCSNYTKHVFSASDLKPLISKHQK